MVQGGSKGLVNRGLHCQAIASGGQGLYTSVPSSTRSEGPLHAGERTGIYMAASAHVCSQVRPGASMLTEGYLDTPPWVSSLVTSGDGKSWPLPGAGWRLLGSWWT